MIMFSLNCSNSWFTECYLYLELLHLNSASELLELPPKDIPDSDLSSGKSSLKISFTLWAFLIMPASSSVWLNSFEPLPLFPYNPLLLIFFYPWDGFYITNLRSSSLELFLFISIDDYFLKTSLLFGRRLEVICFERLYDLSYYKYSSSISSSILSIP